MDDTKSGEENDTGETKKKRLANTVSLDNNFEMSSLQQPLSMADLAEKKRQKQNRRVTLAFFLVGIAFISIAFPITLTGTIFGLDDIFGIFKVVPEDYAVTAINAFLRFPYALVALIDPFLYGFSNPLVKQKLKSFFKKICCCWCCCRAKQTSGV